MGPFASTKFGGACKGEGTRDSKKIGRGVMVKSSDEFLLSQACLQIERREKRTVMGQPYGKPPSRLGGSSIKGGYRGGEE